MPDISRQDQLGFNHIQCAELHPTFAAEVNGVDFSKSLTDEVFAEIQQAITKVG